METISTSRCNYTTLFLFRNNTSIKQNSTITKEYNIMAYEIKEVTFTGRLFKDAELGENSKGNAMATLGFVMTIGTDRDGNETALWANVYLTGPSAAWVGKYTKGTPIMVKGDLGGVEAYIRNDGTPATNVTIFAREVRELARKGSSENVAKEPF